MIAFTTMKIFSFLILTLCAVRNSFTAAPAGVDASYEDLVKMNVSCFPRDSCKDRNGSIYHEFVDYLCTCDEWCSRLGTCCIDSPHRGLYPVMEPTCRTVGFDCNGPISFYMVDSCGASGGSDPVWQSLCEGDGKDDVMKIAPVTSLSTSVTYKNYFCFRCHEATNDFFYWNAQFCSSANFKSSVHPEDFSVVYDHNKESWVAVDGYGTSLNVNVLFDTPGHKRKLAVACTPDVTSKCSDSWTDENVRNLCKVYSATVSVMVDWNSVKYKNVHCAVCNFLSVEDMHCHYGGRGSCYSPFTFDKLVNLNSVGGNEKCGGGFEWDPFVKRCRRFGCIVPGYVIKNGKCGPP